MNYELEGAFKTLVTKVFTQAEEDWETWKTEEISNKD